MSRLNFNRVVSGATNARVQHFQSRTFAGVIKYQPRFSERTIFRRIFRRNNSAEGGSDGTNVTTGNSGGSSGDAWQSVAGTPQFETDAAMGGTGSLGYILNPGTGAEESIEWNTLDNQLGPEVWVRYYHQVNTFSGVSGQYMGVWLRDSGANSIGALLFGESREISMLNGPGTVVDSEPDSTLSEDTWYRVELHVISHASLGEMEARIYAGHDTTPLWTLGPVTATNTDGSPISIVRFLHKCDASGASSSWMDDLAISTESWIGPSGTSGPTIVSVDPGAITWTGQTVTISTSIPVDPGTVTWTGQTVTYTRFIPIAPTANPGYDANTESARLASTGTTHSFSHPAGSGTRGMIVLAVEYGSGDNISGITWDGVAMTRVQTNADTSGAPGRSSIWFLGSNVATGSKNVQVTLSSDVAFRIWFNAVSLTATAGRDMELLDSDGVNEDADDPSVTLQYGLRVGLAVVCLYSGQANPSQSTELATATLLREDDAGSVTAHSSRQTVPGVNDYVAGVTTGATDDVAFSAAAFSEVVSSHIVWTGQTITVQVTSAAISIDPGQITWTGQTVTLLTSVAVSPGAITWTGQTVTVQVSTVVPVDPGTVTWTGQTVTTSTQVAITAGLITWTGQSIAVVGGGFISIDPGQVTWTGQNVTVLRAIPITTVGAITWTGRTVTIDRSVPVNAGQVTWTGRTVTISTNVGITAGQVVWAGATGIIVGTVILVPIVAGNVTWTGATTITLDVLVGEAHLPPPLAGRDTSRRILRRESHRVGPYYRRT